MLEVKSRDGVCPNLIEIIEIIEMGRGSAKEKSNLIIWSYEN
jgi:hypothetical protein